VAAIKREDVIPRNGRQTWWFVVNVAICSALKSASPLCSDRTDTSQGYLASPSIKASSSAFVKHFSSTPTQNHYNNTDGTMRLEFLLLDSSN